MDCLWTCGEMACLIQLKFYCFFLSLFWHPVAFSFSHKIELFQYVPNPLVFFYVACWDRLPADAWFDGSFRNIQGWKWKYCIDTDTRHPNWVCSAFFFFGKYQQHLHITSLLHLFSSPLCTIAVFQSFSHVSLFLMVPSFFLVNDRN